MTQNIGWGDPQVVATPVEEISLETIKQHVLSWTDSLSVKNSAVTSEREWRDYIKSVCFPTAVRGTQRYDLKNGYKLKLQQTYTYKLGIKDMRDPLSNELIPINKQVDELQTAIEELGNEGPLFAERLIRWKPELVDSEYRKLNPEFPIDKQVKDLIDNILTITEGAPQLELEEPKNG